MSFPCFPGTNPNSHDKRKQEKSLEVDLGCPVKKVIKQGTFPAENTPKPPLKTSEAPLNDGRFDGGSMDIKREIS
jgi:hypothetical protein